MDITRHQTGKKNGITTYVFTTNTQTALVVEVTIKQGWEIVTVQVQQTRKGRLIGKSWDRFPTWEEMKDMKDTFWEDNERVMQLFSNQEKPTHDKSLRLLRPIKGQSIPFPPLKVFE